jgi:hypothetical protein
MAKTKITNVIKYAVLWLNSLGHGVTKISEEINISESQIQKIIESVNTEENKKNSIPTKTSPVGSKVVQNLMITESTSGKKGVTMMTQQASMLHDSLKRKTSSRSDAEAGIFRPRKQ